MTHRTKRLILILLAAALALGMAIPAFGTGTAGSVNLMAVNDTVLTDVTPDNMPRTVGGVLYVPYTMLSYLDTNINLGVKAIYSSVKRTVLVTDETRGVLFDTRANTAADLSGNPVTARAMVRNNMVFLPIDWLCEYFGSISCTRVRTRYGTLIRLTSSAAILSDQSFVSAADNLLADSLNHYLEAGGAGEGTDPAPSGSAAASQPPSGGELYLACRWGSDGAQCAQLAEGRGLRALFLFTPAQLREQDDLVRRLAGAGHTVGLALDGDSPGTCLAQAQEGRRLLAAIARCPALVAAAPNLDGAGREALVQAGFAVWSPTVRGTDYPTGAALARALDPQQVNYVEVSCDRGGSAFLRAALDAMGEENCQIYQATAPALS
ncbi:MAG: hypothetical protein K2P08_06105 [Oscillospiraceae bacterium]|nr:hypothetical protein [Oscillospiraceae bacterium]